MVNWEHKKVLVCGGAGLIGSHMSRKLLELGAEVTIADNLSSGSEKNVEGLYADFQKVDLRAFQACMVMSQGKDAIFQFAADMGGIGYITAIGADIMHNSAMINLNMLEAARRYEISNYFYSSSACVYPEYLQLESEVIPLKEVDAIPAQPDQFYGWEKLFAEKLVEAYQKDYGMNIRMARFHNVYGSVFTAFDKQKGKAPCHLIMKAIKHPNPPFGLWGDGKATRSYLHIDDCIEAVLHLMDSNYEGAINIGSDRLISVDELAALVIEISGKSIAPSHDLSKPQGVRGRNADLTLVEQVLGWKPKVTLEGGLKGVYVWAEEHYNELENI